LIELFGTERGLTRCLGNSQDEATEEIMPLLLWLLGVPLVVVIALMVTHVI